MEEFIFAIPSRRNEHIGDFYDRWVTALKMRSIDPRRSAGLLHDLYFESINLREAIENGYPITIARQATIAFLLSGSQDEAKEMCKLAVGEWMDGKLASLKNRIQSFGNWIDPFAWKPVYAVWRIRYGSPFRRIPSQPR